MTELCYLSKCWLIVDLAWDVMEVGLILLLTT